MAITIPKSWKTILAAERSKDYYTKLMIETETDYLLNDPPIYPPQPLLFNALALTPPEQVRMVIIGQDPYHGEGQAMGLSFSVPDSVRIPPSLQNIYKEIASDLEQDPSDTRFQSGDLTRWAIQGVLLLNATLTVEAGNAGSHQGRGWEQFTDAVIKNVSNEREHVVFMLWGKFAQAKSSLIDESKHLILTAPHPSPLSAHRGFLGCQHFSQTNQYLKDHNLPEIKW